MCALQMRDGEAPSYYNPVEASTLVKLVQGLLSYNTGSGAGVRVQDIGVIATYRNQASLLLHLCYMQSPGVCICVCFAVAWL